jgi:hypothetical protein
VKTIGFAANIPYIIDTSAGPIYFYFGPWSVPSADISLSGINSIEHRFCDPPPAANAICAKTTIDTSKLGRAGIISYSNSSISLQGNSKITNLLLLLPLGTLDLNGSPTFHGVAFLNNLSINGGANIAIPNTPIADGTAWLGNTLIDSDPFIFNNTIRRLGMAVYEVVARRSIGSALVNQ